VHKLSTLDFDVSTRSVAHVADACRDAFLELLSPWGATWGSAELSRWLAGPYRAATQARGLGRGKDARSWLASVHESDVLDHVQSARIAAKTALESAIRNDGRFAVVMLSEAMVVPSGKGYTPVDVEDAPLAKRAVSLVAADFLTRPDAYQAALVCPKCERVAFDAGARERGDCGQHRGSGRPPKLDDSERERILEALSQCAWNQTSAAKLLGISRRTLVTRLTQYGLPRPRKQAGA
jgi:hypothetical protein